MDGKSAIELVKKIEAEVMVPVHYESWKHFTEFELDLEKVVKKEKFEDRVKWLSPGVATLVAEF